MRAEVFETISGSSLIAVLSSAVPAGEDLPITEQLEEILRVRGVGIVDGIVEPDLRARVAWNVAGSG